MSKCATNAVARKGKEARRKALNKMQKFARQAKVLAGA
jgi:hypothetical protein